MRFLETRHLPSTPALMLAALLMLPCRGGLLGQVFPARPQLDSSKPVPPRDEVIRAWRKRQDAIRTFRFAWTEQQTHPKGWLSNPRYPQREWSSMPGLRMDRHVTVPKTLAVDGSSMRYAFEFQRDDEPDGVIVKSAQGGTEGLGEGRHYAYLSVFDGEIGKVSISPLSKDSPAPAVARSRINVDAQNLDTRALLMTFRPLHSLMGSLFLDRAVTNRMRTLHEGKSTFLLEEARDPWGWKMILRLEPERDFIVRQFIVAFEQKLMVYIDIDYREDPKWGWIPSGWRVTQMLDDGSQRLLSEARVTSYSINAPIGTQEFK